MTMIGTVILAVALFILLVAVALLYMVMMTIPPRPAPHRKVQRTLYGRDWPRILEMTKLEKTGRKK